MQPAITNPENSKNQKSLIKDELTYKIIGCAMKVHNTLGNGFQEIIYQRALEIQLTEDGVSFEREFNMPIFYNGQQIGERRVSLEYKRLENLKFKETNQIKETNKSI